MPGDQKNPIDELRKDGPLSGKLPLMVNIIRGEDSSEKRLLAEWLIEALTSTPERNHVLVLMLALAKVVATLNNEEFLNFVTSVRDFYSGVTASLRDDDPLMEIAKGSTAEQKRLFAAELTPDLNCEGVLRDAAMAALTKVVANTEDADARESLATILQAHARDGEAGKVQKALRKKRA